MVQFLNRLLELQWYYNILIECGGICTVKYIRDYIL